MDKLVSFPGANWLGTHSKPFVYIPTDLNSVALFAMVGWKDKVYGYYYYAIDPIELMVKLHVTDDTNNMVAIKYICGELIFYNAGGQPLITVTHAWSIKHQSTVNTVKFPVPADKWATANNVLLRWAWLPAGEPVDDYNFHIQIS